MSRPALVRSFLPLLLLFALRSAVPAQCVGTQVGGLISGAHWTTAGSPYCVIADLNLVNVLVDDGVVVQVDGNFRINVLSGLVAVGTELSPIRFTSATSDWNGIRFDHAPANSVMEWCVVEKADESGVTIIDSLPKLRHCTIEANTNPIPGGGLHISVATGYLTLDSCVIRGNSSSVAGGGLSIDMGNGYACILEGCTVEENGVNVPVSGGSYFGGGIYFTPVDGDLVVSGSTIRANYVNAFQGAAQGGGLYASGGNVQLVGSRLLENWAKGFGTFVFCGVGQGGGMIFFGPSNTLEIRNSLLAYNHSLVPGTCEASGCGLYLASGTGEVVNSTLTRNGALSADSRAIHNDGALSIRSSILYWNNPSGVCPPGAVTYGLQLGGSGSTAVTFSDVQNGGVPLPGTGNLDTSPVFVNSDAPICDIGVSPSAGALDATLAPGSPCIDAGQTGVPFRDACFPPSQGGVRNDMGFTGGPQACAGSSPALLGLRTCGTNPSTYSSNEIVLGTSWCATVDCPPSGQPLFLIGIYDAPLSLQLGNGYCVLVNITHPRLVTVGPMACASTPCSPVPVSSALVGLALYTQAVHFGASSFALSNSQDFVVGTF